PDGADVLDRGLAVIFQQARNELALYGLADVLLAGAVDEQEHGKFAVDLGDVTLEDYLREDGSNERLLVNVRDESAVSNAVAKCDDVKVPDWKLSCAAFAEINVREIAEN